MIDRSYRLIKNCRDNDVLRESFFKLAKETFDLDFKIWYEGGNWGDGYLPFSIADGEKILANVSVNLMRFDEGGEEKNYIQLGTVMTEEGYRGKGLIRELMGEVFKEFGGRTEGFYLFANDTVLDFYPRFGFRKATEYQYTKSVQNKGSMQVCRLSMDSESARNRLKEAVRHSAVNGAFTALNNESLIMFYMTLSETETVYYIENQNAYVIAGQEDERLVLYNIFSEKPADVNRIIEAFGSSISTVVFAFTPFDTRGMELEEVHEENTTLFVFGRAFEDFEQKKKMFPALSHA